MSDKKQKSPQSKRRGLSDDDEEIWAHLTRSVRPLKKSHATPHQIMSTSEKLVSQIKESSSQPLKSLPTSKDKLSLIVSQKKGFSDDTNIGRDDFPEFSKHYARKLRRGHIEIEARIDLHGMRQQEAYTALKRFLHSSIVKGKRWVLVITGKGSSAQRSFANNEGRFSNDTQRGVLKRNVPLWLADPDLRPLVVSFTEAAAEHGGSGALYVHLRRQSRD